MNNAMLGEVAEDVKNIIRQWAQRYCLVGVTMTLQPEHIKSLMVAIVDLCAEYEAMIDLAKDEQHQALDCLEAAERRGEIAGLREASNYALCLGFREIAVNCQNRIAELEKSDK